MYYYTNEAEACRLDIRVKYTAESLKERLKKKEYWTGFYMAWKQRLALKSKNKDTA